MTEADVCITIGNTMKLEFEALGGKNVKVITNGFDEEDLPISNPSRMKPLVSRTLVF